MKGRNARLLLPCMHRSRKQRRTLALSHSHPARVQALEKVHSGWGYSSSLLKCRRRDLVLLLPVLTMVVFPILRAPQEFVQPCALDNAEARGLIAGTAWCCLRC